MFETVTLNFGSTTHIYKKDRVIKNNIHAFAFVTGYLSCQIFLMTFVNWPDKDLRPVADSVSFGTDKIGSDLQRNRKKSVPN